MGLGCCMGFDFDVYCFENEDCDIIDIIEIDGVEEMLDMVVDVVVDVLLFDIVIVCFFF